MRCVKIFISALLATCAGSLFASPTVTPVADSAASPIVNKITAISPAAVVKSGAKSSVGSPSAAPGATTLPARLRLTYIGPYGVPASMSFTAENGKYRAETTVNVPLYRIRFVSEGKIDGQVITPSSFTQFKKDKLYASAIFSNKTVRYGKIGQEKVADLTGPVLDIFTLSWQFALNGIRLPAALSVTNAKNIYPVEKLEFLGDSRMRLNAMEVPVKRYRVVRSGGDSVVYDFLPTLYNLPARIQYNDDNKQYTLRLQSIESQGKKVLPE